MKKEYTEIEKQFYIALDQNYIDKTELKGISDQNLTCKKLLNGFINYYKNTQDER